MQEVPLMPWWWPIFLNIWVVVGAPIGIFIGAYLTRRWQRKQWIADNKKDEYRQILKAMSAAISPIMESVLSVVRNAEDEQDRHRLENRSYETFDESIFLEENFLKDVRQEWVEAVHLFNTHRDKIKFLREYEAITKKIRSSALTLFK